MQVRAIAAFSATGPLGPHTIERREVGEHDVLIAIAYAGICHSDIHTVRGEWDEQTYPLVVGHEIAGTVAAVGTEVTRFSVGNRVGVGCMVDSCRECANCRAGEEQHCLQGETGTYAGIGRDGKITQGGYSTYIVVDEDFVLTIPDGIGLDEAASLLCAGITLYAPLDRWGAAPGKNVAIVGLGGLGHIGVKIAHALGAEVTVLSQSLKKEEDARRLGADHYHATGDAAAFELLASSFDVIINTVSADLDTEAYLGLLALDGALVSVGLPPGPLQTPTYTLARMRRVLTGSKIGGIRQTQKMLDFCAAHGLGANIEVIRAEQINEAYNRVVASDVRYRFVIDTATI